MGVRESIKRVDAYDKVTGAAKFTADLLPTGALVAKVVRSTIANGKVLSFDLSEALKVKGDKGDAFLYEDFTPAQLEALKVKGDPFLYSDFTPEQLEALKVKGDPLTYADLTEANKDDLRQPIYDDLLSLIYAGL